MWSALCGASVAQVAPAPEQVLWATDPAVRATLYAGMGRYAAQVERVTGLLRRGLAEPSAACRLGALRAVGDLGVKAGDLAPDIADRLLDAEPNVRAAATKALGRVRPDLEVACQRLNAVFAAARDTIEAPVAVAEVSWEEWQLTRADSRFDLARPESAAIDGLYPRLPPETVARLVGECGANEPERIAEALHEIARLDGLPVALVEAAVPLVAHADFRVRRAALQALAKVSGRQEVFAATTKCLRDKVDVVQDAAIKTVDTRTPEYRRVLLPEFLALLRSGDARSQLATLRRVGSFVEHVDTLTPALLDLIAAKDPVRVQWALHALGELRPSDPATVLKIVHQLDATDLSVRLRAAEALARIGARAERLALAPLYRVLAEDDVDLVRAAAVSALGRIYADDRQVRLTLVAALQDRQGRVAGAAERCWRALATRSATPGTR